MQTTENYGLKKPESTDQYNIEDFNENMDILDKKLQEVFLRGNELKEMLVSNLVAYGIEADTSETFEVLFEKMATIETGVDTSDATATAAQILTGKTAYVDGAKVTGTMADKTGTTEYTATASLDATNKTLEMTVPAAGFYNTSNRLKATFATIASLIGLTSAKLASGNTILGISGDSNVVNTSAGTATAAQILTGKIAYVDGAKVTGTMATKAGTTVDASAVTSDDMYTYLTVPANAYYSTASKLRTLNSNLGNLIDGTCEILDLYNNGDNAIPIKIPIILPSNCTYKIIYNNEYGDAYDGQTTKQYTVTETNNCIILGIGYSYNDASVKPELSSNKGTLEQAFDTGKYTIGTGTYYLKGYKATNIKGATLTFSDVAYTKEYLWLIIYQN